MTIIIYIIGVVVKKKMINMIFNYEEVYSTPVEVPANYVEVYNAYVELTNHINLNYK
jgi:hypothetical protein